MVGHLIIGILKIPCVLPLGNCLYEDTSLISGHLLVLTSMETHVNYTSILSLELMAKLSSTHISLDTS